MRRVFFDFGTRLITLLGTGLILGFFSEFYFLNEGPVFDLVAALHDTPVTAAFGFGGLILFYALFAYPFLIAFGMFQVGTWQGLLLAGGLYGLAAEALVVPVVYEAPPFSFVWTSLSWHTLVDVMLGWWLLRLALRGRMLWAIGLPVALGLFWGVWATWFWGETPEMALSLEDFAAMAWVTGAALLLGTFLADRAPPSAFRASWIEIAVVAALSLALFAMTALPYLPLLPLAIVAILALTVLALRTQSGGTVALSLARLDTPPPAYRYLMVLLIPAAAVGSYATVLATGFQLDTELVVLPMTFLGAASFLFVLVAAFVRKAA
ncbi:MAG TPA: hypothetical protein ENK63_00440 [Rhodobacterales bacterium]|nr:hypothetical protein [Rhodobacterales bacterium]